MFSKYVLGLLGVLCCSVTPVLGQQAAPAEDSKEVSRLPLRIPALPIPGCQHATTADLSFRSRLCYQANSIASVTAAFRALTSAEYSMLLGYVPRHFHDDFDLHLEYFYARRAADHFGQLVAGSLNHEPMEQGQSNKTGFRERTHAALLSVVRIQDEDGSRMAMGPLAGSLASGFATTECCGYRRGPEIALRRAGVSYAGNFATAVFREFAPDIKERLLRKFWPGAGR